MATPVLLTPEAEAQIRRIDSWWRGNRPLAPNLFIEEFAAACELLGGAPEAGKRYPHSEVAGVRRILMRATRNHVYYRVHEGAVLVLSVWGAVRGSGPDLKDLTPAGDS